MSFLAKCHNFSDSSYSEPRQLLIFQWVELKLVLNVQKTIRIIYDMGSFKSLSVNCNSREMYNRKSFFTQTKNLCFSKIHVSTSFYFVPNKF